MGLFGWGQSGPTPPVPPVVASGLPVAPFDFTKRYDVYCTCGVEERVYENVRFVGTRTLHDVFEFSSGLGGFLEIELADGATMMIPSYGIHLICAHGVQPAFQVLQRWRGNW